MAGPVAAMAALLLTNSPAPTIPPIEIMVMWRGCSERLSSGMLFPFNCSLTSRPRRVSARGRSRRLQEQRRQLRPYLRQRPAARGGGDVHRGERLAVFPEHRGGNGDVAAVTLLVRPGVAGLARRLDALQYLLRIGGGQRGHGR